MTGLDPFEAAAEALETAAAAIREAARARANGDGPPALLSVEAAARRLGIGRTSTFALIRSGALPSHSIGRRRLVSAAAIDDYLAASNDRGR